jgi:hypothetical protein
MALMSTATVQFHEKARPVEVRTTKELDELLDCVISGARGNLGCAGLVRVHDCAVVFMIAPPLSLVRVENPRRRRYYMTIGKSTALRNRSFQLLGARKEADRRHMIPLALGRSVLREFFETGELSILVAWEEGNLETADASG